jgi:hypothetical protein
MPMSGRCDVVRIIEGLDGEVPFEMLLDIRFGYGEHVPFIEPTGDGVCFLSGPDAFVLRIPMAVDLSAHRVSAYFPVRKGDRIPIQLSWYASHEKPPAMAALNMPCCPRSSSGKTAWHVVLTGAAGAMP